MKALAITLTALSYIAASCAISGNTRSTADALEVVARTLHDLETYSSAHEETQGDVSSIANARTAFEALTLRLREAAEDGRDEVDATDLLRALDEATAPLLLSEDPRVGQLAIALRGSLNLLAPALSGQAHPE